MYLLWLSFKWQCICIYNYYNQQINCKKKEGYKSTYLIVDTFLPSKIESKKAFLSSNLVILCASMKESLVSPSPLSRGSSTGVLKQSSISTWLSLIHWARKNCLANCKKENFGWAHMTVLMCSTLVAFIASINAR